MSDTATIHSTHNQNRTVRVRQTPPRRVMAAYETMDDRTQAATLARELSRHISGEIRFSDGDRALYATDASNYRQVPIGVVIPKSVDDVVTAVALCRKYGAPLLARGGGTSLAGECTNTAVVIDFSKYLNGVLEVDPNRRLARVQPGTILDVLRDAAERYHLTFGPDPATHDHNTLGGMLGNNSCGVHSVMAGRTSDNVHALDILTYDGLRLTVGPTSEDELRAIIAAGGRRGEIYRRLDELRRRYADQLRQRYPHIPRRVSGYENLDQLFPENGCNVARALVGTEGTCVTILEATLNLIPSPQHRVLVLLGFPDIFQAADAVPRVLEHKPIGLEGIDEELIDYMRKKHLHAKDAEILPEGCGWLVVEFGADTEDEAVSQAASLIREVKADDRIHAKLIRDQAQQQTIWTVRESALGATAYVPGQPDTWPGWEDSAVPRDKLGDYLCNLKSLFHKHGYDASVYGHFGDGLVHCRINFDLRTERGVANWHSFMEEAADLVVGYGGTLSGEHGDGQARAELLEKMYGPELMRCFREFKAIWDPRGKMNPGKVIDPYPITSNLRVGPDYRPPQLETHFRYPNDGGSFAHAVQRCVGVGKCRRIDSDGGVMCPSYMATREEKHSTRGRARLLFEMLHGGPLQEGWRSDAVEDALNLCLACKGCKGDCPVNVDMATYKAEFRSHYYAGRLRPRAAYSMGLIHRWAHIAGHMPWLANFLTQTPGVSALVKWAGGIAQQRDMPPFAEINFVAWFQQHRPRNPNGPRVLLFPDTFNTYFRPETAVAATLLLEEAGWRVDIPRRPVCCGRPLYDWGMLDSAKSLLRQILDTLHEDIEAGVPMVGLEPACAATFRDELVEMFPADDRARRLSKQTFLLSEFIDRHGDDFPLPHVKRKALVQVHCHHHAVMTADAERRVLQRLGLDAEVLPSGCCGMAGSFGFESEKYDVSMKAAERVLLPAVRKADTGTLILANGFSCREQVEQNSARETRHLAEVIADGMGLKPGIALHRAQRASPVGNLILTGGAFAIGVAIGAWLGRGSMARCGR
jgi:FAD/FMN-containing dehydrogenase/Fe-S oxidoreductase